MVHGSFRSLSPAGLLIEDIVIERDRILIIARSRAVAGECPDCGERSQWVHSSYERRLLDLPSHGRTVQLRVAVRRFRCARPGCPREAWLSCHPEVRIISRDRGGGYGQAATRAAPQAV